MINNRIHKQISHSFYIDLRDGKKKKLTRCSLCSSGPYVQEDFNREIFELMPGMCYCAPCMRMHNHPFEIEDLPSNYQDSVLDEGLIKLGFEPDIEIDNKSPDEEIEKSPDEEITEDIKRWYVFTIRCKDGFIYNGFSQDVPRVIKYINTFSGPRSLRSRDKVPVKLIDTKEVSTKKDAIKLKKELTDIKDESTHLENCTTFQ